MEISDSMKLYAAWLVDMDALQLFFFLKKKKVFWMLGYKTWILLTIICNEEDISFKVTPHNGCILSFLGFLEGASYSFNKLKLSWSDSGPRVVNLAIISLICPEIKIVRNFKAEISLFFPQFNFAQLASAYLSGIKKTKISWKICPLR